MYRKVYSYASREIVRIYNYIFYKICFIGKEECIATLNSLQQVLRMRSKIIVFETVCRRSFRNKESTSIFDIIGIMAFS